MKLRLFLVNTKNLQLVLNTNVENSHEQCFALAILSVVVVKTSFISS